MKKTTTTNPPPPYVEAAQEYYSHLNARVKFWKAFRKASGEVFCVMVRAALVLGSCLAVALGVCALADRWDRGNKDHTMVQEDHDKLFKLGWELGTDQEYNQRWLSSLNQRIEKLEKVVFSPANTIQYSNQWVVTNMVFTLTNFDAPTPITVITNIGGKVNMTVYLDDFVRDELVTNYNAVTLPR